MSSTGYSGSSVRLTLTLVQLVVATMGAMLVSILLLDTTFVATSALPLTDSSWGRW
jgi:hypothetical protein